MENISEQIRELNTLPKGYISKKKINGKEYCYLQNLDAGKLKSTYLRENEIEEVYQGIRRRKELESELGEILNQGRNAPSVSKRARELTGSLMMADAEVARFEKGQLIWSDDKRAPLYILRTGNISGFLASRAIDKSRTNSRILKKVMDIHGEPDDMVSLYSYGATITDNYWFRAKGSKLKYKDITFDSDCYCDLALNGEVLVFGKKSKLTPQLTLTGSYEKCWRLIDGKWWLYKKGNAAEVFSECFCANLASAMGIPTAGYEAVSGDVRTENFAAEYNFEPMMSIAGDDDSYENVFNKLDAIDSQSAKDYIKLIWFDTIVNNVDRHNENCGLMRDRTNGEIIGLAPNFDNNLALVARSTVLNMDPSKDGLISYFRKFIKQNKRAAEYYKEMKLPNITKTMVRNSMPETELDIDKNQLIDYIVQRAKYIR